MWKGVENQPHNLTCILDTWKSKAIKIEHLLIRFKHVI